MSLPLSLHLRNRLAVVVGGGAVGMRKVRALLDAGARVRVVAPQVSDDLLALERDGAVALVRRTYATGDLDGAVLAVAATSDDATNAQVIADARAAGVIAVDASDPDRGDATMLATIRLDGLTLAVDTGGAAPAFAQRIARELREHVGERHAAAARALARLRPLVKAALPPDRRGAVLRALAQLPLERLATLPDRTLAIATRGSALALAQARTVAAALFSHGIACEVRTFTTIGDRVQDRPLDALGTENVFVTELERALRAGDADCAVHSCKDLPSTLAADMRIAAILARADARDVFCSERYASLDELPPGATVGTSSPRRVAQLRALRPDLHLVSLRGNVDTRLRKLREGVCDAIVLAAAGLERLGARATHVVPFDPDVLVPAVAQGAIAVETLGARDDLAAQLHDVLADSTSECLVGAERAALRTLHAGCNVAAGIHARMRSDGTIVLAGALARTDGTIARAWVHGTASDALAAEELGARLASILAERAALPAPLRGEQILLLRSSEGPGRIAAVLRAEGGAVRELRVQAAATARLGEWRPTMIVIPSSGSAAALRALIPLAADCVPAPVVVAMGPSSARAAAEHGFPAALTADDATLEGLLATLYRRAAAIAR
jgi:hydroxymethylbilane synthase